MKGLNTLIKLHKRSLDELRRQMVALENQKAQLLSLSAKLKDELAAEIVTASRNPEMGNFFGNFSKRIEKRQLEIAKEVAALDKQMKDLDVQIVAAFAELKKFEIALDNAKKRKQAEADRRETGEMDEIAGQQHRRKAEDMV